jgi:hypothetical protein
MAELSQLHSDGVIITSTPAKPNTVLQESKMKFVILGEWAGRFRDRVFDTWLAAVEAIEAELEWTGAGRHTERAWDSGWTLDGVVLAEILEVAA